ncbi:MAG TPA: hypothetical protein VK439_14690 [Rubrivivax sp.]|nr:hypothetical protein [Rubrivivax sp.]
MQEHLIIGASHALYMAQALGTVAADLSQASAGAVPIDAPDVDGRFKLLLLSPRTRFLSFQQGEDGGIQVTANAALLRDVQAHDRPGSKVFLLINGNEHNARFMVRHARPFDFVHPGVPGLLPGRQILPLPLMHQLLSQALLETQLTVAYLARLLPRAQTFVVAPPPPIGCDRHIQSLPEIFDFSHHPVEHARVRLKIYEVMLECLARAVQPAGVRLLMPPPEHRDAVGFLREPLWFSCTHAASDYYHAVYAAAGVASLASV